MNRRRQVIARVAVVVLACFGAMPAFLFIISGPPDPVYNGKPLSYWLRQEPQWDRSKGQFIRPLNAADTNAVPLLLHELNRRDGPLHHGYASLWRHSPVWLQGRLPKLADTTQIRENAVQLLFGLIGTNAEVRSPLLVPTLIYCVEHETNLQVRIDALYMLGPVGRGEGKGDPTVVHTLICALQDKDPGVRSSALSALRGVGPDAAPAIPALIDTLKDSDSWNRLAAATTLTGLGPEATTPAVLVLIDLASNDPNLVVRMYARDLLKKVDPAAQTKAMIK